MSTSNTARSIFGAIMLVTGCCIGAGMIGLPIRSALAGFLPATAAMVFCYLFTTITGLFIAEATLWFDRRVNLPTIVESTLGKQGKLITSVLFLALFYSLFVAYLDGGGMIFADLFSSMTGYKVPKYIGIMTCAAMVVLMTYTGTHLSNRFNQVLLLGLVISYLLLIAVGLSHASFPANKPFHLSATLNVIPIALICFGYQNLVPSLTYHLNKNMVHLRIAIIIGNLIPLFVYTLWNYVILGILPPNAAMSGNAEIITQLLGNAVSIVSIVVLVKTFSLFAMLTSFIPNAVSLVDFIKDSLKKTFHTEVKANLFYTALVFVPAFVFTLSFPNVFLSMLDFAGGFVDVLLFGILPALVVLIGRRTIGIGKYQVYGGSATPMLIILASIFILVIKAGLVFW